MQCMFCESSHVFNKKIPEHFRQDFDEVLLCFQFFFRS